ncbi:MAG: GNAT family N-acetyltransferase [Candidatus Omnitrophota bacterium]|nr:GNAT family N-acetyltransferase [Candidatus Omnitrophota bacterium]
MKISNIIKNIIASKISLRELAHYRKDLTTIGPDKLNPITQNSLPNLEINYYQKIPINLIERLNPEIMPMITDTSETLIAMNNSEPIGWAILNPDGIAKVLRPFKYEYKLRESSSYIHGVYIKPEFRGNGIANMLYQEAFKILKGRFNNAHILVDTQELIPNKMAQELGFEPIKKLALIKFFGLKFSCNLNNKIGNAIYLIARALIRLFMVAVKTPFYLLNLLRDKIEDLAYRFFLRLYLIQNSSSKDTLKAAFICKNKPNRILLNLLFPDGYVTKRVKTFLRQKLNLEFKKISKNTDLTVAEEKFDYLNKNLGVWQNIKFMPVFIRQRANTPASLKDFRKKRDRSAYEDIRTAKIRNYTYEFIKNDEKLLVFFYENMYLPYIRKRYNGEEIISPFNLVKRSFKKGGLLLAKDGNRYLSGSVIELSNSAFRPKFIGLLNGDINLLKKDAFSALYYFYFKFASEKGFKTIDLGLSRALLNDGVLRYKAKWKTKVELDKKVSNVFAFRISQLTEPIKRFLMNNPFISIENNSLIGNIYLDSQNVLNEEEIIKKYQLNGISGLKIIHLNGNKNMDLENDRK